MVLCGLRGTTKSDLVAGAFAALATLTNATAWPFLGVLLLYFLFESPRRLPRLLGPWLAISAIVAILLQIRTGGAFLGNVVLNQVGTFPPGLAAALSYGIGKIVRQGGGVMQSEGLFVALALIGLTRFRIASPLDRTTRGALAWYLLATIGSIIYAAKGGTEDYIFSLGEPAVAVLAAGELGAWARTWREGTPRRPALQWIAVMTFLLALPLSGLGLHLSLLHQSRPFELNNTQTDRLVHVIERFSKPGDRILAPPFYAVRAGRTLWQDYSELFIWLMKYKADVTADPPNPDGEGWSKIRAMASAIDNRELPLVILEMGQTGLSPEVMGALRKRYRPVKSNWSGAPDAGDQYLFRTSNTALGIFVPAQENERPDEAAAREADWKAFFAELR
jgi:hypothetical protein